MQSYFRYSALDSLSCNQREFGEDSRLKIQSRSFPGRPLPQIPAPNIQGVAYTQESHSGVICLGTETEGNSTYHIVSLGTREDLCRVRVVMSFLGKKHTVIMYSIMLLSVNGPFRKANQRAWVSLEPPQPLPAQTGRGFLRWLGH